MDQPAAAPSAGPERLTDADAADLRLRRPPDLALLRDVRRPATNALPPDNFQDDPAPLVAHRTSPTNIGMYLLSTVTARDFGWIGTVEMVERLEATLATVDRLERFRGHLYNWYDTRDLRRLDPMYVSTVDSGNLAGHLLDARECVPPRWSSSRCRSRRRSAGSTTRSPDPPIGPRGPLRIAEPRP